MGYNTSNAALAYDMNAMPAYREAPQVPVAPREQRTPRFDVYTGAGRQANQAVSPVFMSVLKTFLHHCGYLHDDWRRPRGACRRTAQVLNSNAELTNTLEKATDESSDLEVMHSVYGADTRIRDLAGAYGWWSPARALHLIFRRMQPRAQRDRDRSVTRR